MKYPQSWHRLFSECNKNRSPCSRRSKRWAARSIRGRHGASRCAASSKCWSCVRPALVPLFCPWSSGCLSRCFVASRIPWLASSRVIARNGDGQEEGGQWKDRHSTTLGVLSFVLLNTIVDASIGAFPQPASQVVDMKRAREIPLVQEILKCHMRSSGIEWRSSRRYNHFV